MSKIQLSPAFNFSIDSSSYLRNAIHHKTKKSLKTVWLLFSEIYKQSSDYVGNFSSSAATKSRIPFKRFKGYFKKTLLVPVVVIVGFVIISVIFISNMMNGSTNSVLSDTDQRVEIQKAKAKQDINKAFLFPLRDEKGKEVSKLKYFLESAQLQDEIVVKGQRATAVKGRTFLIVYLKITNDFNKDISLKTRDYMRLIINGKNEKLAPDIHNDPVDIQAISTKYTRLGFPINDTDKNLILQVGEITGPKQDIKLNLQ